MSMLSRCLAAFVPVFAAVGAVAQHVVVVTTPDLLSLCQHIGGDLVRVQALVKGPQDPHFLEARPSMLQALRRAELLVEVGRELEIGWLGPVVDNARNGAVLVGKPGRLDASAAVRALGVPAAGADRSLGDVHAHGNPHYLLDPLCGLQVAALLRDRFVAAWPAEAATFANNFAAFRQRLAVAMVGEALARRYEYDAEKLAIAFGKGTLADVLREQGDLDDLAGWFGQLLPWRGAVVVADHDLWPYFTERCGVVVGALLEPRPGVSPSTAHLEAVIQQVRRQQLRAILVAPYFPRQHAERVAKATGLGIAAMAHQCGAVAGTDDYLACVDHNVRALAAALAGQAPAKGTPR